MFLYWWEWFKIEENINLGKNGEKLGERVYDLVYNGGVGFRWRIGGFFIVIEVGEYVN